MLVAETTVRMPAFAIAALPMQAWPAPAPATEGDGRRRSRVSRKAHDCLVANRVEDILPKLQQASRDVSEAEKTMAVPAERM